MAYSTCIVFLYKPPKPLEHIITLFFNYYKYTNRKRWLKTSRLIEKLKWGEITKFNSVTLITVESGDFPGFWQFREYYQRKLTIIAVIRCKTKYKLLNMFLMFIIWCIDLGCTNPCLTHSSLDTQLDWSNFQQSPLFSGGWQVKIDHIRLTSNLTCSPT